MHNAGFSNGMLAADGRGRSSGDDNTLRCVSLSVTLKSSNLPLLCWNEIIRPFWLDLCSTKDITGTLRCYKDNMGTLSVSLVILITVQTKKSYLEAFCNTYNGKKMVYFERCSLECLYTLHLLGKPAFPYKALE